MRIVNKRVLGIARLFGDGRKLKIYCSARPPKPFGLLGA